MEKTQNSWHHRANFVKVHCKNQENLDWNCSILFWFEFWFPRSLLAKVCASFQNLQLSNYGSNGVTSLILNFNLLETNPTAVSVEIDCAGAVSGSASRNYSELIVLRIIYSVTILLVRLKKHFFYLDTDAKRVLPSRNGLRRRHGRVVFAVGWEVRPSHSRSTTYLEHFWHQPHEKDPAWVWGNPMHSLLLT